MVDKSSENLLFDKNYVWHPYTSMKNPLPVYPVESAEGVYIRLKDGRSLIDGMASWWCTVHGYNVKELNRAAQEQLKKMSHVMFGGLTHDPAVELARLLKEITPSGLDHVFLCDSGSVAVEAAMKMALQYWFVQDRPSKKRFLTLLKGYHGDTFHAMSVCDPENGMHGMYTGVLPEQIFVREPQVGFYDEWDEADLKPVEEALSQRADEIAAVILEPLVQGAGGMRFYHSEYIKGIRALCDKYNVLFIADEIATGFGRTGKLFACEHSGVCPDIMTLGKAMTGGYMTQAAVLAVHKVAEGVSDKGGVFMHGPTFMANPLACAVSAASIRLLLSSPWQQRVGTMQKALRKGLSSLKKLTAVKDVRVFGAIGVVEMEDPVDVSLLQKLFVEEGLWIRPFNRLVYVMPPFIINEEELGILTSGIVKVLSEVYAGER